MVGKVIEGKNEETNRKIFMLDVSSSVVSWFLIRGPKPAGAGIASPLI